MWALFGARPRDKFSLENLQYLYNTLVRNPIINDANREAIVETLRTISELLIWGDQHNSNFFDFFLEKNMLSFFAKIVSQPNAGKTAKVQVLQTLSILIQNLTNETSVYYILSNNHVNDLITQDGFDYSDEETIAYYISFLKTLSLQLNKNTIQFFFSQKHNSFALYSQALRFFGHDESMVRAAVRTITLQVFKVEDRAVRNFLLSPGPAQYFSQLVLYMYSLSRRLDEFYSRLQHGAMLKSEKEGVGVIADLVSEFMNCLYYINDVYLLGVDSINKVLTDNLLQRFLLPLLVGSVLPLKVEVPEGRVTPLVALFLLAQVFTGLTHPPVLNTVALSFFGIRPPRSLSNSNSYFANGGLYAQDTNGYPLHPQSHSHHPGYPPLNGSISRSSSSSSAPGTGPGYLSPAHSRMHRDCHLLQHLSSADDRVVLCAVCLLHALVTNPGTDKDLLETAGLLPLRLRKAKSLLDSLVDAKAGLSGHSSALPLSLASGNPAAAATALVAAAHTGAGGGGESAFDTLSQIQSGIFGPSYNAPVMDALLTIALNPSKWRLVTLHMVVRLILELCFNSATNRTSLSEHHARLLEDAHQGCAAILSEILNSYHGPYLLDVFEDEWRRFKPPEPSSFSSDPTLLAPLHSAVAREAPLFKRQPETNAEKIRKAVQQFMLLREARNAFVRTRPRGMPPERDDRKSERMEAPAAPEPVKRGDPLSLTERNAIPCSCTCWINDGVTEKMEQANLYLVIDDQWLILAEADAAQTNRLGASKVRLTHSLVSLEVVVDKTSPEMLHMRVGPGPSSSPSPALGRPSGPVIMTLVFEEKVACNVAYQHLTKAIGILREAKRRLLRRFLGQAQSPRAPGLLKL
eukprot:tig00021352_g20719.t2